MKTCWKCGEDKELEAFWKRKSNADGLDNFCATCKLETRREQSQTPQGLYETKSRIITAYNKQFWFPNYDQYTYQVDHKFSIRKGYQVGISLDVINNKNNLQLLTIYDNRKKGRKCSINIDQLHTTYQNCSRHTRLCEIVRDITDINILEVMRLKITERIDAEKSQIEL